MSFVRIAFLLLAGVAILRAQSSFTFTVLKYDGGGDWYEGLVGVPNLLGFVRTNAKIALEPKPLTATCEELSLSRHRFVYLTGHGEIVFTPRQARLLREHLLSGGFLFANDDYGMDASFRREMKKAFPEKNWVPLPPSHPLFSTWWDFPKGAPKIHEHDGGPPQTLALIEGDRILVLYTFDTDIGDGWAPEQVHHDPAEKRLEALKFGMNVILHNLVR